MIEKLLNLLLTVIIACQFTACKDTDEPSPVPKHGEPVERTVLVYMVADNNLGSYNQLNRADLNEMVKGAAMVVSMGADCSSTTTARGQTEEMSRC